MYLVHATFANKQYITFTVQGDPNQNMLIQMAINLNTFDLVFAKAKCVLIA